MFEEKGVEFRLSAVVKELKGTDGKVSKLYLFQPQLMVFCVVSSSPL